jgi:hypothetical protein
MRQPPGHTHQGKSIYFKLKRKRKKAEKGDFNHADGRTSLFGNRRLWITGIFSD